MHLLRLKNAVQGEDSNHESGCKMKFEAKIHVLEDGDEILRLFSAEKAFDTERVECSVSGSGGGALFSVKANDSAALRAALNSITKILAVFEKAKGIEK